MNVFTEYWMKQPYEHRLAARFGEFPLNQPELPLEWEAINQPLLPFNTLGQAAIVLTQEDEDE